MSTKITAAIASARAEAFAEAASHLQQDWTDDAVEREQAVYCISQISALEVEWRLKAYDLERQDSDK